MSPTRRFQLVQRVTDEKERRQAQRRAQSRTRVAQCEAKLKELQGYQAGYLRDFDKRAASGIGGAGIVRCVLCSSGGGLAAGGGRSPGARTCSAL